MIKAAPVVGVFRAPRQACAQQRVELVVGKGVLVVGIEAKHEHLFGLFSQ